MFATHFNQHIASICQGQNVFRVSGKSCLDRGVGVHSDEPGQIVQGPVIVDQNTYPGLGIELSQLEKHFWCWCDLDAYNASNVT